MAGSILPASTICRPSCWSSRRRSMTILASLPTNGLCSAASSSPEDDILRRVRRDRVPYDVWRDQGFLTTTPGNATDFSFIEKEIVDLAARFDMRELSYDRTFAGEIVQNLQDEGLSLVQFGQGFLSMA